ncbi:alcohol dehydrogenase [Planctomycetia bacterium]|nr:alcohol dehydrogenase [Planctomycetia bacterium]
MNGATRGGGGVGAYEFLAPPKILFGAGRIADLGTTVAGQGRSAWIVASPRGLAAAGGRDAVAALLAAAGVAATVVGQARGEPTVADVAGLLERQVHQPRDGVVVVAIGGGSAIDLGKALAGLVTNVGVTQAGTGAGSDTDFDAAVVDRLEGVGRGLPLTEPVLPLVAVPTTAGTGAEATRNAVISCPRRGFKRSLRSPLLVPRAALVDPALTLTCDRGTTVAAGLDCITQLVESFISRFAQPLPRGLVLEALPGAIAALPRVVVDPGDIAARSTLAHAALVSGMALANSGLGMAHGVAAALGVECGAAHGAACAALLPVAMRVNRQVAERDLARLERAIDPAAAAADGPAADAFVVRIERLCALVGAPARLRDLGLRRDRIGWLAANSGGASMRGNPVALEAADLLPILEAIY